jgi:transposase
MKRPHSKVADFRGFGLVRVTDLSSRRSTTPESMPGLGHSRFGPYLYRARNLIERFFNKINQCRRVAARYDKLAANDLAFIKLASIRICMRADGSTP